jgi:Na+-translocating ferredoxin:NAD+ oxidoreductase RnfC subunit
MRSDIVDKIRAAGVVGAGGAGFPTHVKVQFDVEQVLANGASCEPLLVSDPYLIEHHTDLIIDGLSTVMDCTNAGKGTICVKSKHRSALEALTAKIAGNGYAQHIKVFELDDYYPAGDEFILVNEVIGQVVPEGGIPLNVLAVVCNVESLLNVSRAMAGQPVTDRYLTVSGEVHNPVICKVPIGTAVEEVIQLAGGPSIPDYGIVMGGPMMGKVLAGNQDPVTKTTSGLIVLPPQHSIIRDKQKDMERISLEPHKIMRHLAYKPGMEGEILEDALICSECGVCEKFACPMMLSPREINTVLKQKCLAEGVKREPKRETYKVSPFFDTRKVPVQRLMERLEVIKYDSHPEFTTDEVQVDNVNILLQQHLGKPSLPVIGKGDRVKKGDLIGEIPEGALGARIHASIDGTVSSVDDERIIIQSQ